MAGLSRYLKPMLNAGSSRVFNCNDTLNKLERAKADNAYMFKMPSIHRMVVIKEAIGRDDPRHPRCVPIGTKLYLPYNTGDIYEGGRSVFFHAPNLMKVFSEQFGVRIDKESSADLEHDMKIFRTLDELPSLDGFLMRDALELQGFNVNENYFEVSDSERVAIQEFIRGKMEPLVRAAYGTGRSISGKVTQLVDKIWEAKDIDALDPLIQAFRFPRDEALSIFGAWKGIIFYAFEYHRSRLKREKLALWLKEDAMPRHLLPRDTMEAIESSRRGAIERLREHWVEVDTLFKKYDQCYADFIASANPGGFINFLRGAKDVYWQLGDSLSKINHAINCWDITTKNAAGRRLPVEQLVNHLELMRAILSPASVVRSTEAA